MKKVLIMGNSGAGKSTLARQICSKYMLEHLDLDTLAWKDTSIPQRRELCDSEKDIETFIGAHNGWVIEGSYSDLLNIAIEDSNELIFMNLSTELCIENARRREWEPHKYNSKEEQDKNLEMLIDWISLYAKRTDTFSKSAHESLYNGYKGSKKIITENIRTNYEK